MLLFVAVLLGNREVVRREDITLFVGEEARSRKPGARKKTFGRTSGVAVTCWVYARREVVRSWKGRPGKVARRQECPPYAVAFGCASYAAASAQFQVLGFAPRLASSAL
jgi:hypothetical protein